MDDGHGVKLRTMQTLHCLLLGFLVLVSSLLNSLIILKNNKLLQLNLLYRYLVWELLYGSQSFLKLHCANIIIPCEMKLSLVSKPNRRTNK